MGANMVVIGRSFMGRAGQFAVVAAISGLAGCASTPVNLVSLDIRDEVVYRKGGGGLFTGKAYHVREDIGWRTEYPIRNGRLNGPLLEWDRDGNLVYCTDYVDGKIDGYYRGWWTNGLRAIQVEYKRGRQSGESKTWWENGQLKASGRRNDDGEEEPPQYWDEKGKRITSKEMTDLTKRKIYEEYLRTKDREGLH